VETNAAIAAEGDDAMTAYGRKLFGIAAAFNFTVALGLLFLRPTLTPLLGLDPIAGTNLVLLYLVVALVATFGYVYLRTALDPLRSRAMIEVGAIGKLLAVIAVSVPWLAGEVSWQLPALVGGDAVFAALFFDFLRRAPVV
jgi:hypothetical protein